MKRCLMVWAVLLPFVLGSAIISCGDDDNRGHPLQQDDGDLHAKEMGDQMKCDVNDVVITDCYDACSCCYMGQEDNMADCVFDCDKVLMKMNDEDINPTNANYTAYKECTLGCVSLCGGGEENGACWNECRHYLDL